MENKKDILFRNQLALASLFFFGPLTRGMIKRNSFNLVEEDRTFIKGYIKLGNLALILLFIYMVIIISKFYFLQSILITVSQILIIVLLGILILGVIGIFSNINIDHKRKNNDIDIDTKNLFLNYLPLLNIYMRYKNHNFDKPDVINKESIILRSLLIMILPIGNVFLNTIFILIIIARFVSLSMGIDILTPNTKNTINKLFYTNPEEIRGYILASIRYLFNKNKKNEINIENLIEEEKVEYKKLYHTQEITHIKIQYIILIILLGVLIYFNLENINIIIFSLFVVGRYSIMQLKWNHLPSIPIIKEIVFGIIKVFHGFTSKNENK